jgi:hypothetical protein
LLKGVKMFYLEADSVGPIVELFKAQIDSPTPTLIETGRKGPLFTIRVSVKDADVHSDGMRPQPA